MITIFGTSLAAYAPWFLLAIPVATAILVYTFRARGSSATTVTSSLFLVAKLPLHLPARRTFLPPPQFWLELCAFLLLCAAAAGLSLANAGRRVAVLIDNSTSMSARTTTQSTLLDEAKRLAQSDIAQALNTHRFEIFSVASELIPVTDGAVSSSRAASAIESITPVHSHDALASSTSSLLTRDSFDSVWVYTDKSKDLSSEETRLRVTTIPREQGRIQNTWIHSASLAKVADKPYIRVEISSSSDTPIQPTVSALCSSKDSSGSFALPGTTAAVTRNQTAILNLGPLLSPWSFCSITLIPDSRGVSDAISLDNTAYIVNNPSSSAIVVSGPLSPADLGLARLPDYSFQSPSPQSPAGHLKTIYHRVTPKDLPRSAALVVFPPEGSLPWSGGSVTSISSTTKSEISRWAETHPIMRYTQPQLLSIPTARALSCPDSATPILFSQHGALACAGEERGSRYLIVGFELFPFDGVASPTLSVFTLNALTWLFNSQLVADQRLALPTELLASPDSLKRLAPNPAPIPTSERLSAPRSPGVYEYSPSTTSPSVHELFASNTFSDEESDVATERSFLAPPQTLAVATDKPREVGLEGALAAFALLILIIDLARRILRPIRWGSV